MLPMELGKLVQIVQVCAGACDRQSEPPLRRNAPNLPPSTEFSSCLRTRKWKRYNGVSTSLSQYPSLSCCWAPPVPRPKYPPKGTYRRIDRQTWIPALRRYNLHNAVFPSLRRNLPHIFHRVLELLFCRSKRRRLRYIVRSAHFRNLRRCTRLPSSFHSHQVERISSSCAEWYIGADSMRRRIRDMYGRAYLRFRWARCSWCRRMCRTGVLRRGGITSIARSSYHLVSRRWLELARSRVLRPKMESGPLR